VNSDLQVVEEKCQQFRKLEEKRLAGTSVARLVGVKEFFGLDFEVNEHVLIPRPETELLVEEVLQIKPKSLLDIGTGSGCIAIAVQKNLPRCEVSATDFSARALEVARRNAEKHSVGLEFLKADLLEGVEKSFEVIVANLPYVAENSAELEAGVKKFEPNLALFGGEDGLDLIRKLLIQISRLSEKPKLILLEFGGGEQVKVLREFTEKLFPNAEIQFLRDLAGVSRVLKVETRQCLVSTSHFKLS